MNRKEADRLARQESNLMSLGFTLEEARQLRRISIALRHWAERESNENIVTNIDGTAWINGYRIPNREAGAIRRLKSILNPVAHRLTYYHQTDPRGCALYIVRHSKLRDARKTLDDCHSQIGLSVY
jgi:hypothetical protein